MEPTSKKLNKSAWSWALYDWANSAFATTVMAGFFPIFFKSYWASDLSDAESTFAIGSVNSLVGLLIAFSAPVLGAFADAGDSKRKFLFSFAFLGIITTGYLFFIPDSSWKLAVIFYGLGVIGFSGANVFYDSLLVTVSKEEERNRTSALGFSLGYLGGGILFLLNVIMFLYPNWFGLESQIDAVLWSFMSVALWWFIFSLPIYLNVKEPTQSSSGKSVNRIITEAFSSLVNTARSIKEYKSAVIFLLAYFLYMDGVDTIIRMATSYGSDIGLSATSMIQALLLTQFVGFPATLVFGYYADKFGYKYSLSFAIIVYIFVVLFSSQMDTALEFYVVACVVGLVQGGVQAISRSFFSTLIPTNKAAEFFGFYNFIGKSSVFIGPFMVSGIALVTGSPSYGILSLLILFIPGLILLWMVPDKN
ncbi:MAG: MFS transporter [Gammaproteobacteria bacterium]|jgi:UMF1 family MFS transporter|nr:MFS transporter [SAR86 cluster bacterium]GIS74905.1 MAG: MFS transporter [Gammaproteobacteria bacterium]|tara:strand:+ start:2408 stop:3667 length:1260 start_codon:yes stop_codon:yes gene_type:complete